MSAIALSKVLWEELKFNYDTQSPECPVGVKDTQLEDQYTWWASSEEQKPRVTGHWFLEYDSFWFLLFKNPLWYSLAIH